MDGTYLVRFDLELLKVVKDKPLVRFEQPCSTLSHRIRSRTCLDVCCSPEPLTPISKCNPFTRLSAKTDQMCVDTCSKSQITNNLHLPMAQSVNILYVAFQLWG